MTNIAVLVLADVGTVTRDKVMSATPGRAVAAAVVLVVVAIPTVLVVVGQGEQEARTVSLVTATTVPGDGCITTNQTLAGLTCVQLHYGDCGSFAVTLAVEGRDAVSIAT